MQSRAIWQVLHHGSQTLSLELPGLGNEAALPVGAIEIKLELMPRPSKDSCMTEAELMIALKRECAYCATCC